MSEENSARWLCHRCVKKEGATVDADPVLLRVCDGCQVENYTRLVRGAVEAPKEPEPVIEAETVEEVVIKVDIDTEEVDKKLEATKAKIAELNAELAELEK